MDVRREREGEERVSRKKGEWKAQGQEKGRRQGSSL